ncbi:diguanylate cyclase [Catellatospora sp. KI3]|uniref:diguanylate cyclase n=1 Tax=Catellatospora sp. KI3 TaxID=3041620 RepID=UPI0024823B0B|nr:diguanylate cyclase [Catellatospora sp. KI3]MDI1460020.1 diguanylate cyclase [Catellatospora sp. KI3]
MTLRARLTTAFLAVVLSPVLLGAFFVGTTVSTVSHERADERLSVASGAVRTAVGSLCGQLRAVAEAVAAAPADRRMAVAEHLVGTGLAAGVHLDGGTSGDTTRQAPPPPWADCAGPDPQVHPDLVAGYEALSARVPLPGKNGGTVAAAVTVDADLIQRLAQASGAQLTLLPGTGGQPAATRTETTVPVDAPTVPAAEDVAAEAEAQTAPDAPTGADPQDATPDGALQADGAQSDGTPGDRTQGEGDQGVAAQPGGETFDGLPAGAGPLTGPDGTTPQPDGAADATAGQAGGTADAPDAATADDADAADEGLDVALDPAPQQTDGGTAAAVHTTVGGADVAAVTELARALGDGAVGTAPNGHLVTRLGPVAGEPLPLAVSLPARPPTGMYVLLVGVVLLTTVMAVTVAWWLARTATSPVVELAAAADRVAGGDLEARVPVRGDDELGRLAIAFNHMTRELQTYVAALTASRDQLRGHLGVLGDTLAGTHDLDRILRVILQTARHATGASAGVVLLADPATGALVGQCCEGLDESWTSGERGTLRVPYGTGLTGSVAATGVPRIGRVERDGPRLDTGEPDCRTYMVVPFSAPSLVDNYLPPGTMPGARGVLALYDRVGRDEFDDADLVTLRTFAGQAAVAVDNVRVHEEAQRLSVTDPLTGLFNYRSLRDSLRRESERAARFGRRLCVLALDLDRFKEINDSYGHAAGDAVLAEFAQRIRYEIREVDVAFRHGGEEFVILLPETDEVGGIAVAERLCEAVRREPIVVPSRDGVEDLFVNVTVSIGLAVLPDHGQNGATVLQSADDALYAAKAAGRDTFQVAVVGSVLCPSGGASSSPQAPRQARGR